ncbi:hypothetical protein JX266_012183 [Neoarthrinium moseri]|nr:hypothetical protein JX266_012183 [Neoarthrinium moseri]
MQPLGDAQSTLFPKITSKIHMIHTEIRKRPLPLRPGILPVVGTVKLHGTHADIVFPDPWASDDFTLQSRNRVDLTPDRDNQGFAAFALARKPRILELRTRILDRYCELNASSPGATSQPLIIAGEFIGSGMRQLTGTAVNTLPYQAFVVLGLNIDARWQCDEDYTSICDGFDGEDDRIYHISRGGFFHERLQLTQPDGGIRHLMEHMNAVAARCPFAASIGVEGIGEGVVWKPYDDGGDDADDEDDNHANTPQRRAKTYLPPEFWLKTKAEEFWHTQKPSVRPRWKLGVTKETAKEFAAEKVTERRLQQGLEYLHEMGIDASTKRGLGDFINWLAKDVQVEEALEIKEMGMEPAWVSAEVRTIAKAWYLKRIDAQSNVGGT